jgi:hypothetical protein
MLNPDQLPALSDEQRARLLDPVAQALYEILDDARTSHEAAMLTHALASASEVSAAERGSALNHQVAMSCASDEALHALVFYIVSGFSCVGPPDDETRPDALHDGCRVARNTVNATIASVFVRSRSEVSAPRLVSAPPGAYLLTEDGREIHVGEEIPADCRPLRPVVHSKVAEPEAIEILPGVFTYQEPRP